MTVANGEPAKLNTDANCCNLIELRQYTLHADQRETLIEIFDSEFVETQETLGIAVIGQFRDLDHAQRFVWLRGFENNVVRGQALAAFYDGPDWRAHREAANATMEDSDNVLLLEPAGADRGFRELPPRPDGIRGASAAAGIVVATLYYTKPDSLTPFSALFDRSVRMRFESAGARSIAEYVTSTQVNNFPRLPIRLGEDIFVWLASFESADAFEAYRAELSTDQEWLALTWQTVREHLAREPEVLRLAPTGRSRLSWQ
jgi:hypothetical protein